MDALALLGVSESTNSFSSVAGLQNRMRSEFTSKVTEKSAKHITDVFELQPSVVFDIPVTEPENDVLENAASVDPLLGGAQSSAAPTSVAGPGQPVRRINAIDTLTNQPHDGNVLQQSVAKYIISVLSEIDGTNWVIRSMYRGDQGWTFKYVCKDSWQAWTRQTAKTPPKVPIGAWSNKDGQDPVNMGRPSFDCRGHVTIAFVKTRKIEVKYEHTPLHKSVGQLMEMLVPEPEPLVPIQVANKKAPKEPKPPRLPKEPKTPKAPRSAKKRRAEGEAAEGEGSHPNKRRKKKKGPDAVPPESVMPTNVQHPDVANGAEPGAPAGHITNGTNGHSESQGEAAVNGGATPILRVSQEEANRRRKVAIQLLTEHGIDPATLSTEQFNIFANQSPVLQRESLKMLVKYGAERLRIVHPPGRNGSDSGQASPTPEQQANPADSAHPVDQPQSRPATPSKSKKSRRRKSGPSAAAEDNVAEVGAGDGYAAAAPVSTARGEVKLTRGACESCRTSKEKCDKLKPACSQCLATGIACEYAIAKPRPSRVSRADWEGSETHEASVIDEQQAIVNQQDEPDKQDDEPDSLGSPGFHNEQTEIASSGLVSPPINTPSAYNQASDAYQHDSGLTFPSAALPLAPEVPQHSAIPPTDYIPSTVTNVGTGLNEYTYPPSSQEPSMSFAEQPDLSNVQTHNADLGHQQSRSRRALPSAQPTQSHSTSANAATTQSNGWQAVSNSPTVAPAVASRGSSRQTRTQQPAYSSNSQAYDDVRQQPDWSTASQSTPQTANPPAYKSPSQAAAQTVRAKSRQSIRNTTPVQTAQAGRQSHDQASSVYPVATGSSNSTSASNYDYNQYSTARAEQASTVAYEPYSSHPAPAASSNAYSSYPGYGTRSTTGNSSAAAAPNPTSQTVASSYNATSATAPSTSQWVTATSETQSRNAHSYTANQSAVTGASYNHPSASSQPSSSLPGFNVRPQSTTQTRSSSSAYGQQAQPQRQQTSQQQGYNSYSSQPQTTSNQQSSWYGFNAVNAPSAGYNSAATGSNNAYSGAGSHAHGGGASSGGSYNQTHQRSMNLSSHTYSSIEGGDQALYELLRNSQGNA